MKLLKIEDCSGFFLRTDGAYIPVDRIAKEELLDLVNMTLEEEEVEFDQYDEEKIKNQAHQIIYKNIYEKLRSLKDRRQEFKDESERLFLTEYEKYRENS